MDHAVANIFLIILPLILLASTGLVFAKTGIISAPDWRAIEKLSFRVLIPALIINSIYKSNLSLQASGPYVVAMILTILAIGFIALPLRLMTSGTHLSNASLSSIVQVTTRWNAFIVLPVAAQLFGAGGLALIAIAMAFLIPLINIGNIVVVSMLLATTIRPLGILITIAKNPMVIGSVLGLLINFSGVQLGTVFENTLDLLSRGTVAIGLLCIGASFDWRRLLTPSWQVVLGTVAKNLLAPLIFFGFAALFSLNNMETLCGMLVVAAPAATNGFIIAKQMGGDADLYAYTLSWQLVASIITIPAIIYQSGVG